MREVGTGGYGLPVSTSSPRPRARGILFAVLAAATFLPVHFVHPIRVPRWRLVNLAALVLWGALALFALAQNLDPPGWVAAALSAIAIYFVIAGLLRTAD